MFLAVCGAIAGATQLRVGVEDEALHEALEQRAAREASTLLPCSGPGLRVDALQASRRFIGSEIRGSARLVSPQDEECSAEVTFTAIHETGPQRHGRSREARYQLTSLELDER